MGAESIALWRDIKSIAADALERPESEREGWVRHACSGDPAKSSAVLKLLGFAEVLDEPAPSPTGRFSGQKIGPYQIHWLLGAGGMGEVYLATRTDHVRMRVAMKFLRPDCAHPGLVRRFRSEAQILAALDHPNIVKLLDAGETEDSQPYFVMSYVEGSPINAWCAEHEATLSQRLQLFRTVCQAVQYAHDSLLIHRDLKPSNVLVTVDGKLKLMDFGVAKLLRPELMGKLEADIPTAAWERPMTPAYASPEQLRGGPITTSADVYSLGVILFELLTGTVPFSPKATTSWEEFVHRVQTEEIPKPSGSNKDVCTSPPRGIVPRQLQGDLDNIVIKCLQKAPEWRYRTPQELAEDIERYQKGLRVRANPNSLGHRMAKHGRSIGLAGVGAAALLVGGAWYLSRSLPPPRITAYTQITHDGLLKELVGTDGSRLYFNEKSPSSIEQVGVKGGEIARLPVAMPLDQGRLMDITSDGSTALIQTVEEGHYFPNAPPPIWVAPSLGGEVKRIGEGLGERFSADGESVIYSSQGDIFTVRIDGTDRKKLVNTKFGGAEFQWSPNGKTVRFSAFDEQDEDHPLNSLWEMSIDGTGLHPLLPNWEKETDQCCGRWMPDGHFFVFLAGDQLWALDERRGQFRKPPSVPVQLTNGPMIWDEPIPSKDGTKIFTDGETLRGELSRVDPKTGTLQPFLGGISAECVAFSPDGNFVAYVAYPEGTLWRANRDGSNRMQLTKPTAGLVLNPRWSPDSKEILFFSWSQSHSEINRVSAKDGSPRWLLAGESVMRNDPNWSPDGKRVLFHEAPSSNPTIGNGDLRVVDLNTQQVTILPGSQGKWSPRWSSDGRYIAALSGPDIGHLPVFDLKLQRWSDLRPSGGVDYPSFSRDNKFLYFLRIKPEQGVFRIPVTGGKEERVVNLKDWHLTGHTGVYMSLDPSDAPLVMRDVGSDDLYALTFEEK